MSARRVYPRVRLNQPWDLQARTILNNAISGKLNVLGEVTLQPGAPTTVLHDNLITQGSLIVLMPMTLNAAMALQNLFFQPTTTGSVTIDHTDNAQLDRVFRYAVLG